MHSVVRIVLDMVGTSVRTVYYPWYGFISVRITNLLIIINVVVIMLTCLYAYCKCTIYYDSLEQFHNVTLLRRYKRKTV